MRYPKVLSMRHGTVALNVYPNVIEVYNNFADDEPVLKLTPEEWAEMVTFVGITGLHNEPVCGAHHA